MGGGVAFDLGSVAIGLEFAGDLEAFAGEVIEDPVGGFFEHLLGDEDVEGGAVEFDEFVTGGAEGDDFGDGADDGGILADEGIDLGDVGGFDGGAGDRGGRGSHGRWGGGGSGGRRGGGGGGGCGSGRRGGGNGDGSGAEAEGLDEFGAAAVGEVGEGDGLFTTVFEDECDLAGDDGFDRGFEHGSLAGDPGVDGLSGKAAEGEAESGECQGRF